MSDQTEVNTQQTGKGAKFDPSIQYSWKQNDVFLLNGAELQFLYNALSERLDNPEALKVIKDYQCLQIVQSLLAKAVQDGIAVPSTQVSTPSAPRQQDPYPKINQMESLK